MIKRLILKYNNLSLAKKSALWFTFVNFLNLGINIITTPIITRMLTTYEFGEINVYQTWYNIFRIIITLNLSAGIFEVMLVDYREDRDSVTNSLITLTSIFSIIALIIFVVFANFFSKTTGLSLQLLLILVFDVFFHTIFLFFLVKNRFVYNFKSSVILTMVISLSRIVLTLLLISYVNYNNVILYVSGMAIPFIVVGFIVLVFLFKNNKSKINVKYWKIAVRFNIVLIPHYLANVLLSSSDKIIISKMVGNDKTGIYSLSYSVASLIMILLNSIMVVFTPYTYNMLKEKKYKAIRDKANILIVIASGFVIALILGAPEAIKIFAPNEYTEGVYLIPPITLGVFMTFMYSLFSNIEFYFKKNKFIMVATILSFALNITLNILFIPIFGYQAAAYTTLVAYLLMAFIHYIIYKRIISEPIYDMKFITLIISITIIAGMILMFTYPFFIIRLFFGILVLLILFLKRKKIINALKS